MRESAHIILVSQRYNILSTKLPRLVIPIVLAVVACMIVVTAMLFFINTRDMLTELTIRRSEHEHQRLMAQLDSLHGYVGSMEQDFDEQIFFDNRQRTYLQMSCIHPDIWSMGIGGSQPASDYVDVSSQTAVLLSDLDEKVDAMLGKYYLRDASLEEISARIDSKKYLWAHIPSIHPVPGRRLGSGFGYRVDPIDRRTIRMHWGVDIGAPRGTAIYATADGVVSYTGWNGGYGLCIDIAHGYGFKTRYAHCSSILAKRGDIVKRGQKIATVGGTGRTTCSHLHYEVMVSGIKVNPVPYIDTSGIIVD
jgi:hypothetical protein